MEWMLLPIKRYADFSGRSRRKEYWMYVLFNLLLLVVFGTLMLVGAFVGRSEEGPGAGFWIALALYVVVSLALLVPSIAVQVRRFHDQGRSGWFWLMNLIPYVGGLIVLVFMCLEGESGDNAWGPDPKREG
ncbi:DUF805 domain-containing protein [Nostoc sp. RF31YmG]|jgi:uncharacterized membrane protein YhaH (DUF805 family)|nr:DUF805 domain-containing protein [Nostoc sp. RF31YmG]